MTRLRETQNGKDDQNNLVLRRDKPVVAERASVYVSETNSLAIEPLKIASEKTKTETPFESKESLKSVSALASKFEKNPDSIPVRPNIGSKPNLSRHNSKEQLLKTSSGDNLQLKNEAALSTSAKLSQRDLSKDLGQKSARSSNQNLNEKIDSDTNIEVKPKKTHSRQSSSSNQLYASDTNAKAGGGITSSRSRERLDQIAIQSNMKKSQSNESLSAKNASNIKKSRSNESLSATAGHIPKSKSNESLSRLDGERQGGLSRSGSMKMLDEGNNNLRRSASSKDRLASLGKLSKGASSSSSIENLSDVPPPKAISNSSLSEKKDASKGSTRRPSRQEIEMTSRRPSRQEMEPKLLTKRAETQSMGILESSYDQVR